MKTANHKIGIIGAGRLGTTLARSLAKAGYAVSIINSKNPASLELQLRILLPDVEARPVNELIEWADIVILAVPLREYTKLPLELMRGKIVIDAMNYWAPIDGKIAEFEQYAGSSSELVAGSMPDVYIVKTLNSVAYNELEEHALPAEHSRRRAIPLAGDDARANAIVSELIDAIGFDAVDLGKLREGRHFQPGTELFNQRLTAREIRQSLNGR